MIKIDLKKECRELYSAKEKKPALIDARGFNYIMIDGKGNPNNSQAFQTAIETLFSTAYAVKAFAKKSLNKDFTVPPLEGLWWAEDMAVFSAGKKDSWFWTLMIPLPDFADNSLVIEAIMTVKIKKPHLKTDVLRFENYSEGKSVQMLHLGAYNEEAESMKLLHAFIKANGYAMEKKHHEIYLSDFRRTPPEKLKTILRQPVR